MPIQQMFLGAGSASTKVQDLFSADLYTGNGSARSIDNGISLSGEGGMVWVKSRTSTEDQLIFDTPRGAGKYFATNDNLAEGSNNSFLSAFNSDGFSLGTSNDVNASSQDFVAWTFRKHPKFFDIQTATVGSNDTIYATGITHQLESDVGLAIFKSRNNTSQGVNWLIWHHETTDAVNEYYRFDDYGIRTSGNTLSYNSSNKTFTFGYPAADMNDRMRPGTGAASNVVGYFFADNNGDGEFGSAGNEDIIKVGHYYGNGNSTGTAVNLGFEPQYVLLRQNGRSPYSDWLVFDSARGVTAGSADKILKPNTSGIETSSDWIKFTSTGFQLETTDGAVNKFNNIYMYVAIRKDQ